MAGYAYDCPFEVDIAEEGTYIDDEDADSVILEEDQDQGDNRTVGHSQEEAVHNHTEDMVHDMGLQEEEHILEVVRSQEVQSVDEEGSLQVLRACVLRTWRLRAVGDTHVGVVLKEKMAWVYVNCY